MSLQTTRMNAPSLAHGLKSQLSQFGLNPQDWQVLPLTTGEYCAVHKVDQELVLVGNICFDEVEAHWQCLELLDDDVVA